MRSTSTKNRKAGLSAIWKEAFDEKDDFIALFLQEANPLGQTLTCGPPNAPYAALTLFPISLQWAGEIYAGYYLYALGVLKAQRGNGYGRHLLRDAHHYALQNKGSFILLQPTNDALFTYYENAGYTHSICRARLTCSRKELEMGESNLHKNLQELSFPTTNRFFWPETMRQYLIKECLFRGGALIGQTAFCYPQQNDSGVYVEIKEFDTSAFPANMLIRELLNLFPRAGQFDFYGKVQSPLIPPYKQTPFALLRFMNPDVEALINSRQSIYFALGLD